MTVRAGWQRLSLLATVFVVGAMVVSALFLNEFRSQNWDPMQTRVYVQRAARFGGTFYENGLLNKGPVEPMVYRLAAAVTSADGFWYAISAMVIVVSGVLAWAASATVRTFGGHRLLGSGVGILVFFHFTLGKADYAGTLYSRNMIVGLFAGAWLISITPRWWLPSRAPWAAASVGLLLGLGVQTLFVSVVAALGIGYVAWSNVQANGVTDDRIARRSRRVLTTTPVLVFLAAPAYYLLRGRFEEFWSGYWTYNHYQNIATGRSLANQVVYGRDVGLRYYRAWPVSLIIVVAFAALTAALWASSSRRERTIQVGISIWFFGAWAELVAGQRYSTHYYSILALPTALMAAAVIARLYRLVRRERGEFRSAAAWPLAAALFAIAAGGGQNLTLGLQAASAYTSVGRAAAERQAREPGNQRSIRAVMDLVSAPGDPLLAWTEYPWVYLNYRRTAATRWIWKSFMLGQIYLGRSSQDYVLGPTWDWFAQDMAEARPAVFLEEVASPVTAGTPFAGYVEANFRSVYTNADNIVHLRNDLAEAILRGDPGQPFTPVTPLAAATAWLVGPGRATLAPTTAPSLVDVIELSRTRCTRISGTYLATTADAASFLSFRFDAADGFAPNVRLNIVGDQIFSGDDFAIFDTTYLGSDGPPLPDQGDPLAAAAGASDPQAPTPAPSEHEFAVVVGDRSAALVIDGAVRAAVRLGGQTRLSLEVRQGGVQLTGLSRAGPPPNSGCSPG